MAALKHESILWFTREATVLISVMCVIYQVWFVSECDFLGFLVCFFEQVWKQVLGMRFRNFCGYCAYCFTVLWELESGLMEKIYTFRYVHIHTRACTLIHTHTEGQT